MKNTAKKFAISALFIVPMVFLGTNSASAREIKSTNERELVSRVHAANAGWDWEPRCAGGAEWDWHDMECEGGTGDHHGDNHSDHHGDHHDDHHGDHHHHED